MTSFHTKRSAPKPIIIILAWATVGALGILSLSGSLLMASVFLGGSSNDSSIQRFFILFGFLGIHALLLLIISLWRSRKRLFVQQLLVGVWIGVAIYTLFAGGGTVAYIADNVSSDNATTTTCSSPLEQYRNHGSAIVPIRTNDGIGSGVIIDDKGTVLTANHVIDGAKEIYANYSTGKIGATVLATAPQYDLALLKLTTFNPEYFTLATNYTTGDDVLVYGYPYNALTAGSPSVTSGIVSRVLTIADLRMTQADFSDGLEYIQTDAAVNSGNSGGALIGNCGLIGIVVSVSDSAQLSDYVGAVSEQGISFAVSTKTAAQAFNLPIANQ